jgi:hypothetical protein
MLNGPRNNLTILGNGVVIGSLPCNHRSQVSCLGQAALRLEQTNNELKLVLVYHDPIIYCVRRTSGCLGIEMKDNVVDLFHWL